VEDLMPRLIIDDREIEVPVGTKVIDAAEELGIMIPRFCYHKALGPLGACRMCAVKFLQGPFKGVQMSCMIDAQDGMVVSTTDPEAVRFRRLVIEWLMLHHPHDCPVCDEGGQCLLQDETVSGGHGIRRYPGRKRTYKDQYLGPLIQHEMNRCIHCYRCSRFYQEYAGYMDLGALQIANKVYFGRFRDGVLESPFSGNLLDICPTGVYTDKPSRYSGRRWDYRRIPSICINCSIGCHTVVSVRYREVVCLEARFSRDVNGWFMCDRGRYGFSYTNLPERPRSPRIEGREAYFEQAIQAAISRLRRIGREPQAVACIGSTRNSLETQTALARICLEKKWPSPGFFADRAEADRVHAAVSGLRSGLGISLREVESADFILAIGSDPINEAPMLALAMRQAQRAGAFVAVLDPRPVSLPFRFLPLPAGLSDIAGCIGLLLRSAVERKAAAALGEAAEKFCDAAPEIEHALKDRITEAAGHLRRSKRPIVICGTDQASGSLQPLAAAFAFLLKTGGRNPGLFYTLPGPNAFGAVLLGDPASTLSHVVSGIEKGRIKALLLAEHDPFHRFPDRKRLEKALRSLDTLIVLDYLETAAAERAHIFLPTVPHFEAVGIFINHEGRAQLAPPVFQGGIPIRQTGAGSHPPRRYGTGIPGMEPSPAWKIVRQLSGEETPALEHGEADLRLWAASADAALAILPPGRFPEEGIRIERSAKDLPFLSPKTWETARTSEGESFILTESTFGTEELSSRTGFLDEVEAAPSVFIHHRKAGELGVTDGETVQISSAAGEVKVIARVVSEMAEDAIVLPRHRLTGWQDLGPGTKRIGKAISEKVS
jgi:NADH-quinone oxidoreductase subunit G